MTTQYRQQEMHLKACTIEEIISTGKILKDINIFNFNIFLKQHYIYIYSKMLKLKILMSFNILPMEIISSINLLY